MAYSKELKQQAESPARSPAPAKTANPNPKEQRPPPHGRNAPGSRRPYSGGLVAFLKNNRRDLPVFIRRTTIKTRQSEGWVARHAGQKKSRYKGGFRSHHRRKT